MSTTAPVTRSTAGRPLRPAQHPSTLPGPSGTSSTPQPTGLSRSAPPAPQSRPSVRAAWYWENRKSPNRWYWIAVTILCSLGSLSGYLQYRTYRSQFEAQGVTSWLLPWGIVPAATPIDTVASRTSMRESGDMTLVSQPWTLAALAALVAVVWTVAAHLVIVHQENHR